MQNTLREGIVGVVQIEVAIVEQDDVGQVSHELVVLSDAVECRDNAVNGFGSLLFNSKNIAFSVQHEFADCCKHIPKTTSSISATPVVS